VEKPQMKREHGRTRRKGKDAIKMDFAEMRYGIVMDLNSVSSGLGPVADLCEQTMNLQVL
jgi:hypothetical protein